MIDEDSSIYDAYTYMIENGFTGTPVVKNNKKFVGYVSLKEIATSLIKGEADRLNANYENIVNVIKGEKVLKFDDKIEGKIYAATYASEEDFSEIDLNKHSIVIVGGRKLVLDYCIKNKVKLIIIVNNQDISKEMLELAKKNDLVVIEDIAKNDLGMIKVAEAEQRYANLGAENSVNTYEAEGENNTVTMYLLNTFGEKIGDFLEYLD